MLEIIIVIVICKDKYDLFIVTAISPGRQIELFSHSLVAL